MLLYLASIVNLLILEYKLFFIKNNYFFIIKYIFIIFVMFFKNYF